MKCRVEGHGFFEQWEDVLLVVCKRVVIEVEIGLTCGCCAGRSGLLAEVVVRVEGRRQVGGADGLAQEAQRDAVLAVEEHFECRVGLGRGELFGKEPCGSVGKRCAKAVDFLKALAVVHGDGGGDCSWVGFGGEVQRLALRESFQEVRSGLVDGDGLRAGPGGGKSGHG